MHDAEGTRIAILDAAEEVFAEHGFDGARIDSIAEVAGYNKSLIFQYFDDKLGLYSAVIRRADEQTRSTQTEVISRFMHAKDELNADQIRELLAVYVGWYFDYLLEHPRILRIYMWELAEGWQTFSKVLTQRDFDDVSDFEPVLAYVQKAGLLRSDLDPLLQFSPAIFMGSLYLSILPMYRSLIPGNDFFSPAKLAKGRDFVVKFTVNGLLLSPTEAKP